MDSLTLTEQQIAFVRPLPGRVLLEIERNPETIGSLHVPESARDKTISDAVQFGRVLAIGYGGHHETDPETKKLKRYGGLTPADLQPGARVAFRALASELNQRYVLTDARRIDVVLE